MDKQIHKMNRHLFAPFWLAMVILVMTLAAWGQEIGFVRADASPTATSTPPPPVLDPRQEILDKRGVGTEWQADASVAAAESPLIRLSGAVSALHQQGPRLYAGMSDRLLEFDVSDPAHPHLIRQIAMPGTVRQIYWVDASLMYAYVDAESQSGMYAIDLTTTSFRVLTKITPPYYDIIRHIGSRFFFVSREGQLEIWDYKDPVAPVLLSKREKLWEGYYVSDAEIDGDMLYVTSNDDFFAIDVANPQQPRKIGRLHVQAAGKFELSGQGDWAYVLGNNYWLHVVSLADPARPEERARVDGFHFVGDLVAREDHLFLLRRGDYNTSDSLTIFNISQPPQVKQIATVALRTVYITKFSVSDDQLIYAGLTNGLAIYRLQPSNTLLTVGEYRFPNVSDAVASDADKLLYIVEPGLVAALDLSDLFDPRLVWWNVSSDQWNQITAAGRYLFLFARTYFLDGIWHPSVVTVYDRTDPAKPRRIRRLENVFNYDGGVVAEGTLVVGISPDHKNLRILDLTQPGENNYRFDSPIQGNQLAVVAIHNKQLFVRGSSDHGRWHLYQYDITNPSQPRLIGVFNDRLHRYAASMVFRGQLAYVMFEFGPYSWVGRAVTTLRIYPDAVPILVNEQTLALNQLGAGLIVGDTMLTYGSPYGDSVWFDISQPEQPHYVYTTPWGRVLTALGSAIYSTKNSSLLITHRPQQWGSVLAQDAQWGGRTYAVTAWGERVLVGYGHHLLVYDVQSAPAPQLLGASPLLAGQVFGIAVDGDTAYLALGEAGVQTIDLSDPAAPRLLEHTPANSFVWNVTVADGELYVADSGLFDIAVFARNTGSSGPSGFEIIVWDEADVIIRTSSSPLRTESADSDGRYFHAAQGYEGLAIFNLSYSGEISAMQRYRLPGYLMDVAVQGSRDYALDWGGALYRLDLSSLRDPAPPQEQILLPGRAWNVSVAADRAYVSLPEVGFAMVDTGAQLREQSVVRFPTAAQDHIWALTSALVFAGSGKHLYLIDLDGAAGAPPLASAELPARLTALTSAGEIVFAGLDSGNLLSLTESNTELRTLRTTALSPSSPAPVQALIASPPYLIAQTGPSTLHILNIANAAEPRLLSSYQSPLPILSLAVTPPALYLGLQDGGLRVLDISNPNQPQPGAAFITPAHVTHLASNGAYLIAWEFGYGYELFTLSQPLHPDFWFSQRDDSPVDQISLHGNSLFTLNKNEHVREYVLAKNKPFLTLLDTSRRFSGGVVSMVVVDNALIVATHSDGIQRYRTQTLWLPLLQGP